MKNQGISLISLIITIIVIIILAAIVIFSGLGTPDSAQFSNFTQQVDNVYMAVMNQHGDLKVKHALSGDYRTDEQIYLEIAIGQDKGQYAVMQNTDTPETGNSTNGIQYSTTNGCQRIIPATNYLTTKSGLKLPTIRQNKESWYVTKDGRVFNATGYEYDGKTYYNASYYTAKVMPATSGQLQARATEIAKQMLSGDGVVVAEVAAN